jgi:hypothetical protein
VAGLRWGCIDIEGWGRFKDAKVWPGGARSWDWNETGTRHRPGVQPNDLAEIVDAGAEVIVVGRGMHGRLGVPADTVDWLAAHGVEIEVERTGRAVRRYEELRCIRPAGGLFHTTC